jgi:hypothetical protein
VWLVEVVMITSTFCCLLLSAMLMPDIDSAADADAAAAAAAAATNVDRDDKSSTRTQIASQPQSTGSDCIWKTASM